jgi:hypothetical protein
MAFIFSVFTKHAIVQLILVQLCYNQYEPNPAKYVENTRKISPDTPK